MKKFPCQSQTAFISPHQLLCDNVRSDPTLSFRVVRIDGSLECQPVLFDIAIPAYEVGAQSLVVSSTSAYAPSGNVVENAGQSNVSPGEVVDHTKTSCQTFFSTLASNWTPSSIGQTGTWHSRTERRTVWPSPWFVSSLGNNEARETVTDLLLSNERFLPTRFNEMPSLEKPEQLLRSED